MYIITVSKHAPTELKLKEFPNWPMPFTEADHYIRSRVAQCDRMWFTITPVT